MKTHRIPTTVVTGFLGAGKTTLVNYLLEQTRPMPVGIVVNEFGEVGIDGELIVADEDAVVEISNGCVCCTVRRDLVGSVLLLLERYGSRLQRLIVETSGLADPAPVVQTFLADPDLRERVELESVIAVVDARHVAGQLTDDIAREQIVFADHVLLNKADLVEANELAAVEATLRSLNPAARINVGTRSAIAVDALLGQRSFSLDNLLAIEPGLLTEGEHDHEHDTSIASCAFHVPGALDGARFNRWANQLVQLSGAALLRMKGVLNVSGEMRRLHFHSVHMLLETSFGKPWQRDDIRENRFVVIGRGLDVEALRAGLLDCVDPASVPVPPAWTVPALRNGAAAPKAAVSR